MIFVTVGTDTHPFDRLLKEMDRLVEEGKITDKVMAQTGNSAYIPKNYKHSGFFSEAEFFGNMKKANLIISHAGAGSIITAFEYGKPLILVPRRKEYDEHTDDHQMDLARELEKGKRTICVYEINKLEGAIKKLKKEKQKIKKKKPEKIIGIINGKLKEWEK